MFCFFVLILISSLGIAQTGSGKTLAYLLPAFLKFYSISNKYLPGKTSNENRLNPKVLVLAPTRELAQQIFDVIKVFGIFKAIPLYGGNDRRKQIEYLKNHDPLILVSTPGRLKDLADDHCISLEDIVYLGK